MTEWIAIAIGGGFLLTVLTYCAYTTHRALFGIWTRRQSEEA